MTSLSSQSSCTVITNLSETAVVAVKKARVELNDDSRIALYTDLPAKSIEYELPRGTYVKLSVKYGVSKRTVRRL